jgi:hypothetical protein
MEVVMDCFGRCLKHGKPANTADMCEDCYREMVYPQVTTFWDEPKTFPSASSKTKVHIFGGQYTIVVGGGVACFGAAIEEFPDAGTGYGSSIVEATANALANLHNYLQNRGGIRYIKMTLSLDEPDYHEPPNLAAVGEEDPNG